MVFVENLLPRFDILIKNKFELINDSKDDIHIVIYYIDSYKCRIIIRRLDETCGWGIDLKIKLYSVNTNCTDDHEIISIGNNSKNCKILNMYTTIKLEHFVYNPQKIPKLIFQTIFNKNIDNILHYNSILTMIELNPEYEYRLIDDNESRQFIKEFFEENILVAYDMLIPGAFKADLFRYCYLYIHGGCYFDCKHILRKSLTNIINQNDELILCNDIGNFGYYNAVMFSTKKNDLIMNVINACVHKICNFNNIYNFNNRNFNDSPVILSLTGPVLLRETIQNNINFNDVVKFTHKHKKHNHDYQHLCVEFNNEIIIFKNYNYYSQIHNNHYSILWREYKIVYKNIITYFSYKFYTFPYKQTDIYNYYIFDNNVLIIERIDKNEGWLNNLTIKCIDYSINEIFNINIGTSDKKYKIMTFDNNFFKQTNFISSFTIENTFDNDTFNINIIKYNEIYKLIVIRTDINTGWGQDLKLNIILNNNNIINITIGSSLYNVKIKDIGIIF